MIFDVDKALNIHLLFMSLAPIAEEYGITEKKVKAILQHHNPVAKQMGRRNDRDKDDNSFKMNVAKKMGNMVGVDEDVPFSFNLSQMED